MTLLIFQNTFNTFSPFLTLALNLAFVGLLVVNMKARTLTSNNFLLWGAVFLFGWLCFIALVRGDVEKQTLFKYTRSALSIVLFSLLFSNSDVSAKSVIKGLNISLGFHVFLIFAQLFWPGISETTAVIFGFDRELSILEDYALRKLGASSSYDTASLLSIAALVFFSLQFIRGRGKKYFFAAAAAFIASLFSSRGGIVFSLLILAALLFRAIFYSRMHWKILSIAGVAKCQCRLTRLLD